MGQATSRSGGEWKKSKKINLSDQGSVKYSLDRFVSEVCVIKIMAHHYIDLHLFVLVLKLIRVLLFGFFFASRLLSARDMWRI